MLKKNIVIFAIGQVFTKIIQFLLVPLLTFYLSKSSYGTIDIIVTTINISVPILTLSIVESVFRFGADKMCNKKDVFSFGVFILFLASLLSLLIFPLLSNTIYRPYRLFIYIFFIFDSFYSVLSFFVKSQNKTIVYVLSSIIYGLFSCGTAILLIVFLKTDIYGYFLGYSFGYFLAILFLIIFGKLWKYISFGFLKNTSLIKSMLKYSIPLIFNAISWWIMNASDKYITNILLGVDYNGLLAVVHKIPSMLVLLYGIFSSAFQLSAVIEMDFTNPEEDVALIQKKYKKILDSLTVGIIISASFIIALIEPFSKYFLSQDYYNVYQYIPFYIVGNIFYCLASFYGNIYNVVKKNVPVLIGTTIGALLNICFCYIMMKFTQLGLHAAALSTVIAYAFVFAFRYLQSKKYISIPIDSNRFAMVFLVIVQAAIVSYTSITTKSLVALLFMSIFVFAFYFKEVKIILINTLPKSFSKRKTHNYEQN